MGERHLAGMRWPTPADETRDRDRMVRRAERPSAHQLTVPRQQPGDRPDGRGFDHFVAAERRKDRRQPPRQHGLAASRRAPEQHAVNSYEPKGYLLVLQAPGR